MFTGRNLHVAVRVRPLSSIEEQTPGCIPILECGESFLHLKSANHGETENIYAFDSVFDSRTSTLEVYNRVAQPVVSAACAGIHGTIFAYGQTGSGKTFSMQGTEYHPGILPLTALYLFGEHSEPLSISVSYLEIYNEKLSDLLAPAEATRELRIRNDPTHGFFAEGLEEIKVKSYSELVDCFAQGETKRHVAETDMNLKSSRSHTVFVIQITSSDAQSRLNLVDLAGSESVRQSNAEGVRLKEGGQINKSLLVLSMVIASLASSSAKTQHVRFRDSKLTQILQPSLSGSCMTAVVCCVTPASMFSVETSSTLKFANNAKQMKTDPVVNVVKNASSVSQLEKEVERLRVELAEANVAVETAKASEWAKIMQIESLTNAHLQSELNWEAKWAAREESSSPRASQTKAQAVIIKSVQELSILRLENASLRLQLGERRQPLPPSDLLASFDFPKGVNFFTSAVTDAHLEECAKVVKECVRSLDLTDCEGALHGLYRLQRLLDPVVNVESVKINDRRTFTVCLVKISQAVKEKKLDVLLQSALKLLAVLEKNKE